MTTIPVWVEQENGTFTATVPGVPKLTATAGTRDEAVSALVTDLTARQSRGELVMVALPPQPTTPRGPRSAEEEEAWDEVVAEIYRERDEQKRREFPE